jgi:hypothetical protein
VPVTPPAPCRVPVQVGAEGGEAAAAAAAETEKGWQLMAAWEDGGQQGAEHEERAWAARNADKDRLLAAREQQVRLSVSVLVCSASMGVVNAALCG